MSFTGYRSASKKLTLNNREVGTRVQKITLRLWILEKKKKRHCNTQALQNKVCQRTCLCRMGWWRSWCFSKTVFSSACNSSFDIPRTRPSGFCASLLWAEGFSHRGCSDTACAPVVPDASRGLNSHRERAGKAQLCVCFTVPSLEGI